MTTPLDDHYLTWLYAQVAKVRVRESSGTYWKLFRQLYTTEFVWFIANDDNRAQDGCYLRGEFLMYEQIMADDEWLGLGCSMLELLVALSRRLEFEASGVAKDWFWHLLGNLGLADQNDLNFNADLVEEACSRVIWRTYSEKSAGGLFPLRSANQDQREVELWYQMCAYVLEHQ